MVDICHEGAGGILKATHDSVVLQVEKNATAHTGAPTSPSGVRICMGIITVDLTILKIVTFIHMYM